MLGGSFGQNLNINLQRDVVNNLQDRGFFNPQTGSGGMGTGWNPNIGNDIKIEDIPKPQTPRRELTKEESKAISDWQKMYDNKYDYIPNEELKKIKFEKPNFMGLTIAHFGLIALTIGASVGYYYLSVKK